MPSAARCRCAIMHLSSIYPLFIMMRGLLVFSTLHWAEQCTVKWDSPLFYLTCLKGKIEDFLKSWLFLTNLVDTPKNVRFVEEMNQNNEDNCDALTVLHRTTYKEPLIETETQLHSLFKYLHKGCGSQRLLDGLITGRNVWWACLQFYWRKLSTPTTLLPSFGEKNKKQIWILHVDLFAVWKSSQCAHGFVYNKGVKFTCVTYKTHNIT